MVDKNYSEVELYKIFEEHYKSVKDDPQTQIMQKVEGKSLKGPLFISWEITSKCNLQCEHCRAANNNSRSSSNNFDSSDYKRVIEKLGESEIFTLGITGGEPFLHPYFWEILEECKKYNFELIVYTNGTFIDSNVAKRMAGILDTNDILHISLDGGTEVANDRQRGKGSFKKTYKALEHLKDANLSVRLNVVPTKLNVDSIPELCDIAVKFSVKEFGASPLMLAGRASGNHLMPDQEKLFEMEQLVYNRLKFTNTKYIGGISGTVHSYLSLPEWFDDNIYKIKHIGKERKLCDAGNRKLFIDAIGDVYPCNLFAEHKEFIIGNIFYQDIKEIWNSSKLELFRNGYRVENVKCKECKLFELCNGGCMALAYHAYGKLGEIDPRCPMSREKMNCN